MNRSILSTSTHFSGKPDIEAKLLAQAMGQIVQQLNINSSCVSNTPSDNLLSEGNVQYDAVMVFTGESAEQIIAAGGTGNWKAKRKSLESRQFVVAVHNRRAEWGESKGDHGAAFLLGRISNIQEQENRWRKVILVDKYALIDIPGAWPTGNRNPIAYVNLQQVGIDPDALDWKDIKRDDPATTSSGETDVGANPSAAIDQARQIVARAFSVKPSAVRISVDV